MPPDMAGVASLLLLLLCCPLLLRAQLTQEYKCKSVSGASNDFVVGAFNTDAMSHAVNILCKELWISTMAIVNQECHKACFGMVGGYTHAFFAGGTICLCSKHNSITEFHTYGK